MWTGFVFWLLMGPNFKIIQPSLNSCLSTRQNTGSLSAGQTHIYARARNIPNFDGQHPQRSKTCFYQLFFTARNF